ncbi:MAG TPA: MBL fold metallo-hydrolase [Armatimonadota bacterium]|nr:MBL fold metallo-hydrolase [Armatimonadota bacterium]
MKVTILGSGTSTGVPEYRCDCDTCVDARRPGSRNHRTRPSIHVEADGHRLQFDTGPNFLDQIDRCQIPRIDAVLYTHCHADHISGTNDLVMPCRKQESDMRVFGPPQTMEVLQRNFDYLFTREAYQGGGVAHLAPHAVNGTFEIDGVEVTPVPVEHAAVATVGYRLGKLGYVPDAKVIPPKSLRKLRGVDLLILDALSFNSRHPTHLSVAEALAVAAEVAPRRVFFTHIMHRLDHDRFPEQCAEKGISLPENARLSYDGMVLEV